MAYKVAVQHDEEPVVTPVEATLRVGERVTARVDLTSCGGQLRHTDDVTWSVVDPAVVAVDVASGVVTGRAPGATVVEATGGQYGFLGRMRVSVVP